MKIEKEFNMKFPIFKLFERSLIPQWVIASILSYTTHESIGWAILHSIFGYFYVVYWLFTYSNFQEWISQLIVK